MSLVLGDNFSYGGTKPLDARLKYATVADMKAVAESTLYDGCFAYVTGTKKYYTFDSSNTVSEDTGKWREYASGGGGVTVDDEISHESENPVQNKVIADALDEKADVTDGNETISFADYNALSDEEKNNGKAYFIPDADIVTNFTVMGNRFDKANIYTAEERMVGSWMGKPLYQKTVACGALPNNNTKNVPHGISGVDKIVNMSGYAYNGSVFVFMNYPHGNTAGNVLFVSMNVDDTSIIIKDLTNLSDFVESYVTLRYTKTNDATVNIGTGNDYSTDEQVIGTWIDGKKLYQRTFTGTGTSPISLGDDVERVLHIDGYMFEDTPNTYNCIPIWFKDTVGNSISAYATKTKSTNVSEIKFACSSSYTNLPYFITIQYTKTED